MGEHGASTGDAFPRPSPLHRLIVWGFIVGVTWTPGVVALAMILTDHVGR